MKYVGQIKKYNGYYGQIVDQYGHEYLLLKEQVLSKVSLSEGDYVTFVPEHFEKDGCSENIARFIKKIEKKEK